MDKYRSLNEIDIENCHVHYSLGNSKTGKCIIFNMKTGYTCSSQACKTCFLEGCYAKHEETRFPVIYNNDFEDFVLAKKDPSKYFAEVQSVIDKYSRLGYTDVRIHERGDFFSNEYLNGWLEVINRNKNVTFWAYSKQWNNIRPSILNIKSSNNFKLFASKWTGVEVPKDISDSIPVAFYGDVNENIPQDTFVCPSHVVNPMTGKNYTCNDCGYCKKFRKNVCFIAHGVKALSEQRHKLVELKSNNKHVALSKKFVPVSLRSML